MYIHKEIEKKWQAYWEKNKTFKTEKPPLDLKASLHYQGGGQEQKPKYYCLDMFPFPSWAWLHVGHPEWMTANDIVARYKHAKWYNVLHPMWWDAFWLPAENYAIKTWTHPSITTKDNIDNFRKQIKSLWFSYDWDREVDTTDPKYYRWTQWIFLKLFEKGLAYEQDLPINYCPSCKTWLANEEVLNDFTCERCGTKVEKKQIRQWVLAITKYAERLLKDVDRLDWPEWIKDMQRNWIGKSEGCEFELKMAQKNEACISKGVGLNCPAKASCNDSIFKNIEKVKKKTHFLEKIDWFVLNKEKKVLFNSNNLLKHFKSKNLKEFHYRKNILWTVFYNIDKIIFDKNNYGHFIFKNIVIKVVLWEQNNWNYFVKTYYVDDKTTILYKEYLIQSKNIKSIRVYTTRIDTVFGMTYAVIAPDHKDVNDFITEEQYTECVEYIEKANSKSDLDRTQDDKVKTWVFTGSFVINPFNWEEVPLWIADYVLGNYGTWAVMAVPAHDVRDFEFAKTYLPDKDLKIAWIPENLPEFYETLNKEEIEIYLKSIPHLPANWTNDFKDSKIKRAENIQYAEEKWFWENKVNYKLRDWLFSRQRYWGEPIPLVHCEKCWIVAEKEENLPILLPVTDNFEPSWDGTSPLSKIDSFVNCKCPKCDWPWKRETNTMPQWGWSCWYYLRYMDPNNENELVNKDIVNYWWEVDSYVWWAEHAVLHLLYARFWHKFLFDLWIVPTDEPFYRLRNQWLILAYSYQNPIWKLIANDMVEEKDWNFYDMESGDKLEKVVAKMSKSLKNVVNPDEIVDEYGADSLRLYEMYMAEFKDSAPWDSKNIIWVRRFIEKSERLFTAEAKMSSIDDNTTMKLLHKTIKKVQEDIESYKFNTAISSLMILVNNWLPKDCELQKEFKNIFIRLIHPFTPHLAEELWERIWEKESIFFSTWPVYNEAMTIDDTVEIGIQVLWKLRWTIEINKDEDRDVVLEKARNNSDVAKWLEWKEIVKEIYVPGKIVNIVIK